MVAAEVAAAAKAEAVMVAAAMVAAAMDRVARAEAVADKTVVAAVAVDKVVAQATKSPTLQSHSATNLNSNAAQSKWMSSKLAETAP